MHTKFLSIFLQGFWRRRLFMAKPLLQEAGIASIILENPFYGSRKPKAQLYVIILIYKFFQIKLFKIILFKYKFLLLKNTALYFNFSMNKINLKIIHFCISLLKYSSKTCHLLIK